MTILQPMAAMAEGDGHASNQTEVNYAITMSRAFLDDAAVEPLLSLLPSLRPLTLRVIDGSFNPSEQHDTEMLQVLQSEVAAADPSILAAAYENFLQYNFDTAQSADDNPFSDWFARSAANWTFVGMTIAATWGNPATPPAQKVDNTVAIAQAGRQW